MQIQLVFTTQQQAIADAVLERWSWFHGIGHISVPTTAEDFQQELASAAEDEESSLVVIVDAQTLSQSKASPRVFWAPLLTRVENGGARKLGIIAPDTVALPPLLRTARVATPAEAPRKAQRWAAEWLGARKGASGLTEPDFTDQLIAAVVDAPATICIACPEVAAQAVLARQIAGSLAPWFERTQVIDVGHKAKPLRDAAVEQIIPAGRVLWVIKRADSLDFAAPAGASIVRIGNHGSIAAPADLALPTPLDPISRAVELIASIPNADGDPLPCDTAELEELLTRLFAANWQLGERLARKAGAYFRLANRASEAIWAFETLKWQATIQGNIACLQACDDELYWLKAGGARKHQLKAATQGAFEF
jgi:hypothetical protein